MRYRELKFRRKHGNNSWKHRPYHDAKDESLFDSFILNFRQGRRIELVRAERIFYKNINRPDWNGYKKYPKFAKKYFNDLSIEDKVLKKHLWRI